MISQKIKRIRDALTGISGLTVYHYYRTGLTAPWCAWYEESGSSFNADNRRAEYSVSGSVDYFTKDEYDPMIDAIEGALAAVCVFTLNSVQYEEDTNLIHYAWSWEAV